MKINFIYFYKFIIYNINFQKLKINYNKIINIANSK